MYTYNVWHLQCEATQRKKALIFIPLFLSLCDSDEFLFRRQVYAH